MLSGMRTGTAFSLGQPFAKRFHIVPAYPHDRIRWALFKPRLLPGRYDLGKLRAKASVEKLPKSRRYRLCPQGYSICLVFLKLFERVYSPLTAGLLQPYRADAKLQGHKRTQLDRLYQKIVDDLDELLHAVGLKAA